MSGPTDPCPRQRTDRPGSPHRVRVPTLVIGSAKDRLLPMVSSCHIARLAPNLASFVELEAVQEQRLRVPYLRVHREARSYPGEAELS